jgi:hypothetical protein
MKRLEKDISPTVSMLTAVSLTANRFFAVLR